MPDNQMPVGGPDDETTMRDDILNAIAFLQQKLKSITGPAGMGTGGLDKSRDVIQNRPRRIDTAIDDAMYGTGDDENMNGY